MPDEITLTAVAARAGVSIASVSRALNGGVASPATIDRVRAAAAELGYRPNAMARGLKSGRTSQVAMLVPDAANPVYARMMGALQAELAESSLRLLMQQVRQSEVIDAIRDLSPSLVDGAVVVVLQVSDEAIAAVEAAAVPVVVLGLVPEEVAIDSVRADSGSGMRMLVAHLVEQGASRIGFIDGPLETTPGRMRLEGFRAALAEHGLADDLVVVADDFTRQAASVAARTLLDIEVPQAIIGANDIMALATMRACATRGLRVPDDLLLAGIDDTELAEHSIPSLTSIDLGAEVRARLAARTLVDRIAGASPRSPQHAAPRLVVRESTKGRTA